MRPSLIFPLIAILGTPAASVAQQASAGTAILRFTDLAVATPAAPETPVIDGRPDDSAWIGAPAFGGFVQRDPIEGEPALEPTEFKAVFSEAALFVVVRAHDSKPGEIAAILARRDDRTPSDEITIMIDSYLDRRTGYAFSINAAGVKRDAYLFDDSESDERWDAVWEGAARVDSAGWVAEFRIPFNQLRFSGSQIQRVGFNVTRRVARTNEEQYWRLVPKTASGVVSLFGELSGLSGVTPPRRLEVQPYVVARVERRPGVEGNPFAGSGQYGTVGADMRFGLTSALTLTATVNPDFGQVEGDPAEVNLSAFETFQSERRPFFTESSDRFQFGLGGRERWSGGTGLFYSRRIGRAPQGRVDERGGYAETVGRTTILGAGKLTGKTPTGWTIGLLSAVTAQESAAGVDSLGSPFQDAVEPRTGYVVARLSRDLREGRTVIGAFGTTTVRDLPEHLSYLRSGAYSGGLDFTHRFRNDTYRLEARLSGSHVIGSPEAIARTQRSSARYFQRSDLPDGTYDPARTSLSGYAWAVGLGKEAGGNWRWNAGIERRSPGLELNDVGYLREADRTYQWAEVGRNWFRPGRVFRSFRLSLLQRSYWTHDWQRREAGAMVSASFTLPNYWTGRLTVGLEQGGIAPTALRGGPAINRPGESSAWFGLGTDRRKRVRLGLNGSVRFEHETVGRNIRIGTDVAVRPTSSMEVSAEPSITLNRNPWQYLRTVAVDDQPEYLLSDLRQKTASMEIRGAFTFSPSLSLQLYAEPFISSGQYGDFRRVVRPRARRFADQFETIGADRVSVESGQARIDVNGNGSVDAEFGDPDFTYVSFISNMVLRWEYGLGSTLFLVWQHGRSDRGSGGQFGLGRSLDDLLAAQGENVFVIKFNYWLNP